MLQAYLMRDAESRSREAALTLAAALLSFWSAYALRRAFDLSVSLEVLAVALALSLSRVSARPEHRPLRRRLVAYLVLPVVGIGASEVAELFISHPDLGDALFVIGVSATVYVRRFGPRIRRIATFVVLPLISVLIVPAPAVQGLNGSGATRWWAALVAVIALNWVIVLRVWFGAPGALEAVEPARAPRRERRPGDPRWRILGTTKLTLQMAGALAAAFALGRWLFDPHWAWCVLSAFIVSSANRGREDVLWKGVLRVGGSFVGTAGASLIGGLFPAGDAWALVVLFALLSLALWLRPLNYAFWAAGMTGALALLYGYYGESGTSMLGDRLLGVLLGAALAVASAWVIFPFSTRDVIRRDIGLALAALDRLLEALASGQPTAGPALAFRRSVAGLEYHRTLVRGMPARFRGRLDHLVALDGLAAIVPPGSDVDASAAGGLRLLVRRLRKANGEARLPDPEAWGRVVAGLNALAAPAEPAVEAPASLWAEDARHNAGPSGDTQAEVEGEGVTRD